MFIKEIEISNFRVYPFSEQNPFQLQNLRVPSGEKGSGLNVFVGENGTGKTSILDAISFCLTEYKGDTIDIADFNQPDEKLEIRVVADKPFEYLGVMPNTAFKGAGFVFLSKKRERKPNHPSSALVHDLQVIKANGENKPKEGSADLRVAAKNPWIGNRFNNIELVYIEKNRNYSIKAGTFNDTRFDRIMEDLNRQVIQKNKSTESINQELAKLKQDLDCRILSNTIQKFRACSGVGIELKLIDPMGPFNQSFLAHDTLSHISLPLNRIGSGFEMMFSLIYLLESIEYEGREVVILIDEPELHLHPRLQEEFIKILFELSAKAQVFITTHSPLLLKQIFQYTEANIYVSKVVKGEVISFDSSWRVLPYVSANEINYLAFDLPTTEYFNELYGELMEYFNTYSSKEVDKKLQELNIPLNKEWMDARNEANVRCSLICYIRNFIHHPENTLNSPYSIQELEKTIEQMRLILRR